MGTSKTHVVFCHRMRKSYTSFAYLFWLANNKKKKQKTKTKQNKTNPEFCMAYIDGTLYVGSDRHKYYPCCLLSPNPHIKYLICISVLIG